MRFELYGLVSEELGDELNLTRILNRGYLPDHYLCPEDEWKRLILSYVGDYLKEEIAAEGLTRSLSSFADFLNLAALSDTDPVSFTNFGRDVGVSPNTIKEYYSILVDTLQGWWLPAFASRPKRRMRLSPKFYFSDVGTVNHLAKRGHLEPGGELFGRALENWVAHELRAYNQYRDRFLELSYWRLSSGGEVDFILGNMECAIEVKASGRPRPEHLKNLQDLMKDHPNVKRKIVVNLEAKQRQTVDGIEIMPALEFARELWAGRLF